MKKKIAIWIGCMVVFSFMLAGYSEAKRPPKPGPHFVWIKAEKNPQGVFIPGHWKYTGPHVEGKEWIPGHYNAHGKWVKGGWAPLPPPPKKGAVWVPGHFGPNGKWVSGHWQ